MALVSWSDMRGHFCSESPHWFSSSSLLDGANDEDPSILFSMQNPWPKMTGTDEHKYLSGAKALPTWRYWDKNQKLSFTVSWWLTSRLTIRKSSCSGRLECPCTRLQTQVYDNPNKLQCTRHTLKDMICTKINGLWLIESRTDSSHFHPFSLLLVSDNIIFCWTHSVILIFIRRKWGKLCNYTYSLYVS